MSNLVHFPKASYDYQHSTVRLDHDLGAAIIGMHPHPRPSFTPELLHDCLAFRDAVASRVREELASGVPQSIRYAVLASDLPGIFNFGGDLDRFVRLIRARDGEGLFEYAIDCVRCVHTFSEGFGVPITSIALVQGRAQGGGFESALSANVLIAEKGTQLGFPEVLFNLFPGMGAYSFLSRKIAPSLAERLILSGQLYEAETLYEMGVVDVLAEPGQGEQQLREFIREADRRSNVHGLMRHVRSTQREVPFEELRQITELWVESALQLGDRDLRMMERLVRAQNRRAEPRARMAN